MKHDELLDKLTQQLAASAVVEGVYLAGSLATQDQDEFSDVDLGVATANRGPALEAAFALRHEWLRAVGEPLHAIERGWAHCRMIAALYGPARFPPLGLEIDIVFSQLRFVTEQMPHGQYRVLFDRRGRLQPALDRAGSPVPGQMLAEEVAGHLRALPFLAHDARIACRRGDGFQVQALCEEIRKQIFFAAGACHGAQVFGAKRAQRHLSGAERSLLNESYGRSDEDMVNRLARLHLDCAARLPPSFLPADALAQAARALQELLSSNPAG